MIPARLLIHSCTYAAPTEYDRDGNATLGTAVTLSQVRLEPVTAATRSTEGESANDRLTLFYVPVLSNPQIVPEPLARVTWNSETYTVRSVTPCYTQGTDTVHHYEAALV